MEKQHLSFHLSAILAVILAACGAGTTSTEQPDAAQGIAVTVSPATARVAPGGSLELSATVTGTANTLVSWSVLEGAGGSVTPEGLYTAPATDGTYHVVAMSDADPSRSAEATVTVTAEPSPPPPPPPPADGAPMTAANRTSGVAPLAVFFDAVDTVPSGSAAPFAWTSGVYQPPDGDYEGVTYVWDFGDPGAGVWSTNGLPRNAATGYTAAHVYESPGVYTATLTVTDEAGAVRTYQQTITVSAFGGTTYYVAAGGNDANSGTDPSAPFATFAKGFSMVNGGSNRRLLLRRGDTFPSSGATVTAAGPGIIGAYGSGARPVLAGAGIVVKAADWRVMDLDIVGPGLTVDQGAAVGFDVSVPTVNALLLRLRSSQFRVGLGWGDWTPMFATPHDGDFMVECEVASAQVNGVYVGGRRMAIMGNDIHDIVTSHVLRVWQGHKAVISHNRLWNPGPTRHALKLHGGAFGDGRAETRFVTVSDNRIRGKTWSVGIGPQDAGSDERVSHVVLERNRFYGESSVQVDLLVWARQVMVRNNVFDGTGTASSYTGVAVQQRGIEPPPQDVRVLGNTVVRRDSASEFYALAIQPVAVNVTCQNNLASAPLAATKTLVSGSAGAGFVNDSNLLAADPAFTDAAGGDYTLQAGSPAVDAGAASPEIRTDFSGNARPRGAGYDVGAFESH